MQSSTRPRVGGVHIFLAVVAALFCGVTRSFAAFPLQANFEMDVNRFVADPVRPRMYATLATANSVVVFDTETLGVLATIPIGSNPIGLAIARDGSKLYVANNNSTTT